MALQLIMNIFAFMMIFLNRILETDQNSDIIIKVIHKESTFSSIYVKILNSISEKNIMSKMVTPRYKRLQNHRPTLVVPPDVTTSIKEISIGNVLFLESLLVKFLPTPKTLRRKYALEWVWEFSYTYL